MENKEIKSLFSKWEEMDIRVLNDMEHQLLMNMDDWTFENVLFMHYHRYKEHEAFDHLLGGLKADETGLCWSCHDAYDGMKQDIKNGVYKNIYDINIEIKHLKYIDKLWKEKVDEDKQRIGKRIKDH